MNKRSLLCIHAAVFLFGASGLFIKIIPVSALLLSLGRGLFSASVLYLVVHFKKYSLYFNRSKDYAWNIVAGIFLAIHWFFFIMSIQVSTVYIGTLVFATYPIFVTFLEPYFFKEKFNIKNIIPLVFTGIGIAFLIPAFHLTNDITLGIVYGLISSFAFALLSMINRRLSLSYHSVVITLYEQLSATLCMTLVIAIVNPELGMGNMNDFLMIIIYGVVFTALAHSLYIHGLKGVKTHTASVISVLEPVYSLLIAIIFLQERLSNTEIIGACSIMLGVMISMFMSTKEKEVETSEIQNTD